MRELEDRIVWEGDHFYVFAVSPRKFEVRKHGVWQSEVVGWGKDREQAIRTGQRLERYPHNVGRN